MKSALEKLYEEVNHPNNQDMPLASIKSLVNELMDEVSSTILQQIIVDLVWNDPDLGASNRSKVLCRVPQGGIVLGFGVMTTEAWPQVGIQGPFINIDTPNNNGFNTHLLTSVDDPPDLYIDRSTFGLSDDPLFALEEFDITVQVYNDDQSPLTAGKAKVFIWTING